MLRTVGSLVYCLVSREHSVRRNIIQSHHEHSRTRRTRRQKERETSEQIYDSISAQVIHSSVFGCLGLTICLSCTQHTNTSHQLVYKIHYPGCSSSSVHLRPSMVRIEDLIRFHTRFTMVNTWSVPIWLELNENYAYAMCSTCPPSRITAEWLSFNLRYFRLLMVLSRVLRWKVWRVLDTQKMTATEGVWERERESAFNLSHWIDFASEKISLKTVNVDRIKRSGVCCERECFFYLCARSPFRSINILCIV